jgi:hypothetical protein
MERHRAEVIAALPSSTCPARTTATVKCGEPGSAELGPTPTGASAVKPDPLARLSRSSGTAAGRVEIRDWARCPSGFLIGNPNRLSEQVRLRRHTRGGSDRDCVGQPAGRARSWSSPSPGAFCLSEDSLLYSWRLASSKNAPEPSLSSVALARMAVRARAAGRRQFPNGCGRRAPETAESGRLARGR